MRSLLGWRWWQGNPRERGGAGLGGFPGNTGRRHGIQLEGMPVGTHSSSPGGRGFKGLRGSRHGKQGDVAHNNDGTHSLSPCERLSQPPVSRLARGSTDSDTGSRFAWQFSRGTHTTFDAAGLWAFNSDPGQHLQRMPGSSLNPPDRSLGAPAQIAATTAAP